MQVTKETTGNTKKQFIGTYLWEIICIAVAIIAAISFAAIANWYAMIWALLAGSGDGLYLRERIGKKRLEQQFRDYVAKTKAVK